MKRTTHSVTYAYAFFDLGQLRVETHLLFAVNHDFLFSHIFGFFYNYAIHRPLLILIAKLCHCTFNGFCAPTMCTYLFNTRLLSRARDAERTFADFDMAHSSRHLALEGPVFARPFETAEQSKNQRRNDRFLLINHSYRTK